MINEHLNELGKRLDSYFSNYDNINYWWFNSDIIENSCMRIVIFIKT